MPAIITAITNQKGGVGKTTVAAALLSCLHQQGVRVLGVDLDPQGSLGFSLGLDIEHCQTVYDVFRGAAEPQDIIANTETCDLLPSNILLSAAELEFNKPGREFLLKTALSKVQDRYDYIIIDCPPSLGLLNTNALTAADSVMIPVQCEYYALEGVTQLLLTIRLVQQLFNKHLMIEGVLLTMYDARTKLSVEVQQEVRKHFKDKVYKSYIPRNIKLSEAPSRGMSIFEYDVRCEGAKAYAGLAAEVVKANRKK